MKSKTKKLAIGGACAALAVAVGIGGTLAYLTVQTEQRANNFTFASDKIDAVLIEPNWDGVIDYEYSNSSRYNIYDYPSSGTLTVYGYTSGDRDQPVTEIKNITETTTRPEYPNNDYGIYGDVAAKNMIPGTVAPKDPQIVNTCDLSEYVAMKITFVYAEGAAKEGQPLSNDDMAKVNAVIEINYDVDADYGTWERIGDTTNASVSQEFAYKEAVGAGLSTQPLFRTVTVKNTAKNDELKALEDIGGFAIWIEGYAAQADAIEDVTTDTDEGSGLTTIITKTAYEVFKEGVVFNNTPEAGKTAAKVAAPYIVGKNEEGLTSVSSESTP